MADKIIEQWLCVGYGTAEKSGKLLTVFSALEGGRYNPESQRLAYALKGKRAVGGIYDVPVTRDGDSITITSRDMVFKGFYQTETVAVLRAEAEAFEYTRKQEAAERKYRQGDGLPETVEAMAKIYAKADWNSRHALEALWLLKMRRASIKHQR